MEQLTGHTKKETGSFKCPSAPQTFFSTVYSSAGSSTYYALGPAAGHSEREQER